jgi:hypothetical protein
MPSTEWKEEIAEGEDEKFARFAEQIAGLAKGRGGKDRALHAKSHANLRARLTIVGDLPPHARQGLFAKASEHRVYLRFSNGSGGRNHDAAGDVRGLAMKILDVDGKKVLGDARTQDFLLIHEDTIAVRTPEEFVTLVLAASNQKTLVSELRRKLGFFRTAQLLFAIARGLPTKPRHSVDRSYFSAVPLAFGPYAAKLALVPLHPKDTSQRAGKEPGYLRELLFERVSRAPLRFELRAQFFEGAETPIEDPTRKWPTPYVVVAHLDVPVQAPRSSGGLELDRFVESLSFDTWHALEAHRPLGAMQRARKHAYFASTQQRSARTEPDGSEWTSFD